MRFILCLSVILFSFSAIAEDWFESSSPLNQAHQKLLHNDLAGSLSSIIQVWQTDPDQYVENHLNELLLKTIESDCGKSISNEPVAEWIHNVVIKRQSVQSPGRRVSRAIVEVTAENNISYITLNSWPDNAISKESSFEVIKGESKDTYRISYELNQRMQSGLYRLEIKGDKDQSWSQWIVMGEPTSRQIVRWESQDSWAVDKIGILNPYCSLPVLTVSLYDYIQDEYVRVWHKQYESDYPTKLPISELEPERYVLAVGITHQRWQGSVVIEDQQVISKTYDISAE